jgi:multidrug resistance efflux pump
VTVRPQVSGVVTQVLFTEGQMVKKGQLLAVIDPRRSRSRCSRRSARACATRRSSRTRA